MPRRTSTRTVAADPAPEASTSSATFSQSLPENLIILRKQWKWAAFSQFFYTFSPLFNMDDVSLKDVEDDLYLGSSLVLPRIMVRLLYTLSYDRKVNLNNWQTTLRRQYNKRNPAANPIGPEPIKEDDYRETASPEPDSAQEETNETTDKAMVTDDFSSREQSTSYQKDDTVNVKSEADLSMPTASRGKSSTSKTKKLLPDDVSEMESKDWLALPMLEKLDSLHLLTEWQFQSPMRVRTLMKSDDDQASWRIEPIGYDAKRNAYWLIGADRLWIQRVPPKPPRPPPKQSAKRKRAVDTKQAPSKSSPSKRPRLQATAKPAVVPHTPGSSGRHGRAAKDQANLKLDAQAKELAELNRQAALLAGHSPKSSTRGAGASKVLSSPARATRSATSARPLGTRLSARLRGAADDEWQAIPDEWLQNDDDDDDYQDTGKRRSPSLRRSVSSISELTELTEESESKESESKEIESKEAEVPAEELQTKEESPSKPADIPQEYVEWETIAVTLQEWEHIAERWMNATHYSEKALYKVLVNHIVPIITEELREVEVKRQKEEAITQRKRSSRIAIRESEKEEARLAAKRKAEAEEKMSRAKRLEARQRKEEEERVKRETAREQRRKEREAKEEKEAKEAEEKERKEKQKAERAAERAKQRSVHSKSGAQSAMSNDVLLLHLPDGSTNGSARGPRVSRTPAGDDWELDCEVCNRRGVNLDERVPLMSCAFCSRWQHIPCHDQLDLQAGRPRRDWDKVEFICRKCRTNARGSAQNGVQMQYPQMMNMHPALRPPAPSPYNHVPYGQGLGFESSTHMGNGYSNVMTNGNKGYGTSDIRSSGPVQMEVSSSGQNSKQISFSHYQPQQHNFSRNGQDSSASYGQLPSTHSYEHYGNDVQNGHTNWNGVSNIYAHGYPSSTSMPHSAERSSATIPESSSRHLPHDQPAYYQQQQQWKSSSDRSERFNAVSDSSTYSNPHEQPTHYQPQQQWGPRQPTALSSQLLSRDSSLQSHPL